MARFVAGAVFGLVVGVLGAAAAGLHAEPDEVEAAALEAGVDPIALAGAVATTGVGPREYLRGVGELQTGQTPTPPVPVIWQKLAGCESTSRWSIVSPPYYGGLQMDMTFWRRYGGLAIASRPDLASPAAQVEIAQRGQAVQGWAAWPACSRRLGLRP